MNIRDKRQAENIAGQLRHAGAHLVEVRYHNRHVATLHWAGWQIIAYVDFGDKRNKISILDVEANSGLDTEILIDVNTHLPVVHHNRNNYTFQGQTYYCGTIAIRTIKDWLTKGYADTAVIREMSDKYYAELD